jgi:clumping factor A
MGRTAMNTKRALKWSLLLAAGGCVAVATMPGCELLVTFDRSKIPDEGGAVDGTVSDGQSGSDSLPNETGPSLDASPEATPDGGAADVKSGDAPHEASVGDATPDTSIADAASDTGTSDGSSDSGSTDVAVEAAVESGVDAAEEAAAEAGAADATDDGGGDDGASDAGVPEAASDSATDGPAESGADDGGTG